MPLFARSMIIATALLGVASVAPAQAAATLSLTAGTPVVSDDNNDGVIAPGDTLSIRVPVTSTGDAATGVQATLTPKTSGVQVVPGGGTSSYPDIATGDTQSNTTPFRVLVDPTTVLCGTTLNFDLSFTSSAGPATASFPVSTGYTGALTDYPGGSRVIGDVNPTTPGRPRSRDLQRLGCSIGPPGHRQAAAGGHRKADCTPTSAS